MRTVAITSTTACRSLPSSSHLTSLFTPLSSSLLVALGTLLSNCLGMVSGVLNITFACRFFLLTSAGHHASTGQSLMWVAALGTDVFDATCREKL